MIAQSKPHLILLGILITVCIGNWYWYWVGTPVQHWDSSIHLMESMDAFSVWTSGRGGYLTFSWYYPPLVSWSAIPVYVVLGVAEAAGYIVIVVWSLVLIGATYGIGRKLYGPATGILSALMIASAPLVVEYSHTFMLDLPLGAMTATAVLCYLYTDRYRSTPFSILFGIVFGCGMLTKWTFLYIFMIPMFIDTVDIVRHKEGRRGRLGNAVISLFTSMVVFLPWYLLHAVQFATGRFGELARGHRSLIDHITYYVRIVTEQFGFETGLLLLFGLIYFIVRRRSTKHEILWLILSGYIMLTITPFKLSRFSFPLLPLIAIAASTGLVNAVETYLGSKRRQILFGVGAWLIIQYLFVLTIPSHSSTGKQFASFGIATVGPASGNWHQRDIVDAINKDIEKTGRENAVVRIIPDQLYFNRATIDCYRRLSKANFTVSGLSGLPHFTDYFVVQTGDTSLQVSTERKIWTERTTLSSLSQQSPYFLLGEWILPDGSTASVYKITNETFNGAEQLLQQKISDHLSKFLSKFLHPKNPIFIEVTPDPQYERGGFPSYSVAITTALAEVGDYSFKKSGVPVRNVSIALNGLQPITGLLLHNDSLVIQHLDGITVRDFLMRAKDIRKYIESIQKGSVSVVSLDIDKGRCSMEVLLERNNIPLTIIFSLESPDQRSLAFRIHRLTVGGMPVPSLLLNTLLSSYNPILRTPEFLREIRIGSVVMDGDSIRIGTR